MPSIFVGDGYDLRGKWDAVPGLYPAGSFRYRPAAPSLRFRYGAARDAAEQEQVACDIVAKQLIDVTVEGDGEARKLDAKHVGQLHAGLFNVIWSYVMGYQGPDVVNGDDAKNSITGPGSTSPTPS
jgi:fido (protein-threonine AMPylation protein)